MISGNVPNCYENEVDNVKANASDGKSCNYKTKITGKTGARPSQDEKDGVTDQPQRVPLPTLNIEVTIALK